MTVSTQTKDIFFAITICLVTAVLVFIKGDALYVGIWYYFAVPMFALFISAFFKPMPFFQTGVAIGIMVIFLTYLSINWGASRPEGMLGLGHLFSLPGAAIGLLFAANSQKRSSSKTFATAFVFEN